jgi:signal transduction histidine kinase
MHLQSPQQDRSERLIATTRLVMAIVALLAIWLDPFQPARNTYIVYALLTGYTFYASVLTILTWRTAISLPRLRLTTHVLDLVFFSLLVYLTEGPTSPFFIYFVFSLACATLHWGWHGTLWTALAALTMFIGMSAYAATVLQDPAFKLNRVIIRTLYLVMAATLLGYVGAYRRRVDSNMFKLAAWPRGTSGEASALVRKIVTYAADLLRAPRVLMFWGEPEEPWIHLALWSRDEFRLSREPPDTFDRLVAKPLSGVSFLCPDAHAPVPRVLYTSSAGLQPWYGLPFHPDLQTRFTIGAALSPRLHGATFEGRLFFLDIRRITPDDLVLSEIIARQVAADLDQFYLSRQLQQAAVMEERLRLARNLHDGLLQSLTGMSLQLAEVHRLLEQDPLAGREYLLDIQRLIAEEQRGLRVLVSELKAATRDVSGADFGLAHRLEAVSKQIERQWGLRVELSMKLPEPQIPTALTHEIYYIVHEALVNAARHAHASTVRTELELQNDHVRITMTDNGRGFPFRGCYDLSALISLQLGPTMLRDRIAALGGSLLLDSTAAGAHVDILLPLAPPRGHDSEMSRAH